MKAFIINIGDELLIGQTINTNSSWMGEHLDLSGVKVIQSVAISDDKQAIIESLNYARKISDVVLITGGLGPTKDDITKHTLCEYFGSKLIRNQEVLDGIEEYFASRGRAMLEVNRDQALLPNNCEVLINTKGTASGMWFEDQGTIFVSMPGVPYEMKYLMECEVIPRLQAKSNLKIYHKTIKTIGIGESYLAELIKDWENKLYDSGLKLAYLPSPGIVKLRISAFGNSQEDNVKLVECFVLELQSLIPEYIFGYNKDQLSEIIGKMLLDRKQTIGLCESCSGGYLSHLISSVSGCSAYYNGSIVSYTNELKNELLQVPLETLNTKGAVSEEVVKAMVIGGLKVLKTNYAIAISGIAGPTGATDTKPVGMICVAVGNHKEVKTFTFYLGQNRERNIMMASLYALNELRKFILAQD